jgi:hypothetical protein
VSLGLPLIVIVDRQRFDAYTDPDPTLDAAPTLKLGQVLTFDRFSVKKSSQSSVTLIKIYSSDSFWIFQLRKISVL